MVKLVVGALDERLGSLGCLGVLGEFALKRKSGGLVRRIQGPHCGSGAGGLETEF